jgi:hypothetical protein
MELITLRPRAGAAYNYEQLYVSGVDVGALLLQLSQGTTGMPTTSAVTAVTERYTANASGTGYTAGQMIGRTELIDLSTTPPISTVMWSNLTAGTNLTVTPVYSTLTLLSSGAATNAELRAAPLSVKIDASSPDLARMGDINDAMAAADGSGVLTVLGGLRRMVNTLNSVAGRLPMSLGQKNMAGSISVVPASDVWESAGLITDANGNITFELQTNGTQTRRRAWSTTVDGLGNVTNQVSGGWVLI